MTWGNPGSVYGGQLPMGYGQISPLGGILQGNDIPGVPGMEQLQPRLLAHGLLRGEQPHRPCPPMALSFNSQVLCWSLIQRKS